MKLDERFEWDRLSEIPHTSGLYAWYVTPELWEADLEDPEQTTVNLCELARKLRNPELDAQINSHLSLSFSGRLEHDHLGCGAVELTPLIQTVLENESKRRAFAHVLKKSAPFLMTPLYVGIAKDLNSRIQDHKTLIDNYSFHSVSDETIDKRPQSFALEVKKRNIFLNHLLVYIVPCPIEIIDPLVPDLDRDVIEAVESVMNRLFFPIFGRR